MSTLEKKMMRAIFGLALLATCSVHAQSTYTWANSNITPTPTASLNWFGAPQGAWTGGTPGSGNLNTIQFFDNTTTSLTHTGNPSTQTSVIDTVGDVAFELGTLTLSGRASAINNAKLNLTISGDAMNFSAATGTINLDARNVDGDQLITYNLNSNIQLGAASSAGALIITGDGTGTFNIGGIISELQTGGGSLTKSGSSSVSLTGSNSYSGGTIINGGSIRAENANALGSGQITFAGNASLYSWYNGTPVYINSVHINSDVTAQFNPTQNQYYKMTFAGPLSGGGTLSVSMTGNGAGYVGFTNSANTFTGAVVATGPGTVRFNSLADSANPIKINNVIFELGGGTATPLLFNTRVIELTNTTGGTIANNTTTATIIINTALAYSGTVGTRALTLGGGNTGTNAFNGSITNYSGSAVSVTKTGGGTWALSGTNTYSGKTTVAPPNSGTLIFQGKQAVSPNTTFETRQNSGSTGKLVFLDDSPGVINLGNSWTFKAENRDNSTANTHIFVGNNSTANGGNNPGSTQTGSTIALGGYFSDSTLSTPAEETINITGANGYRLQLASLQFAPSPGKTSTTVTLKLNPTSVPVTIAGNVTAPMAASSSSVTNVLALDGTALGNLISGVISDPTGAANIAPLKVTKNNSSTWTLSGANTFTGTTTVNGGTLVLAVGTCLSDTNLLSIASGAKVKLNSGVKEVVGLLKTNGVTAVSGTYGSKASTATYKNNTYFDESEAGVLYVGVEIPKSGTLIQFF